MSVAVQPLCLLAHNIANKLTIIIGQCDLLGDHATDPECVVRLQIIRRTAQAMAAEVNTHQCQLAEREL
jgi:hypothetical protein